MTTRNFTTRILVAIFALSLICGTAVAQTTQSASPRPPLPRLLPTYSTSTRLPGPT